MIRRVGWRIGTAAVVLAVSGTAGAAAPLSVAWGARLGANVATFGGSDTGNPGVELGSRVGVYLGGFAELTQGRQSPWFVRPEVALSMKGASQSYSYWFGSFETETQLTYLELAAHGGYRFPSRSPMKFHVTGGPVIGILAAATSETSSVTSGFGSTSGSSDLKDVTSPVDVGLALGAGVTMPMGRRNKITFDLRYTLGMVKVFQPTSGPAPSIFNRTLGLIGGILF